MKALTELSRAELKDRVQKLEALLDKNEADNYQMNQRIARAREILEHVHSRTWYDDVKQALAALEGK